QWLAGYPVPKTQLPEGMTINEDFHAPKTVALSKLDLATAVKKWQEGHKNRPRYAHLLKFENVQNNKKLMAGYLGFDTLPELLHFADFIVPRTIHPLIEIYSRHQEKSTAKFPMAMSPWLKPLLNNGSERCIILRPEGTKALITNPKEVQLKDIDAILTLLCAAYKLMTANPKRFCQKSSGNSDEFTWDFHHEDWFRAYVAIVFTKNRRSKTTEVPEQGPMRYVGVRGIAEKSEIYGYATLDVISSTQTLEEGYYSSAAVEITKEMALLDPEHNTEAMQKLEQRASNEQIARALDAIDSIGKKPQSTRESLVENDDRILEDIISDEVANTLHATAPGIDLHRTLMSTLPKEHQRAEMTEKERQSLIDLLRQTLHDQYQLQTITTAGDVTGLADESGTMGSDKVLDCQLDSLRAMRELLGENIPENQDLEQICESRGIDLATLQVNPHNPSVTAKPLQIPDAHRLAELLSGKLRSAMLLSDCGTGKTFVTLLTLKFLLDERIQAHKKGALDLLDGDRVFKPNIIFVPSATLSQFFSEVNSYWAGIFNIYSFYQSRSNCANTDRQIKTIDTLQDLQKYVDQWAKQHQDPETGRVILLTAYSTATRRLLKRRVGKSLTRDQMELLSSQGDAIDYDRQDEEITAIFEDPPERSEKTLTNDMWNVVVCDECHQIKNPGTRANELVRQLDREALLLVSATPLPNHVRDISGYLRVLWDPAWPFGYQQKGDATNANAFFGDLVYDSLFDESIKLEVGEPLTLNRVLHGRVKTTSQLSPRELRRAMEYKSFVEDQNGPAYLLNPNLFMEFAKNKEYGTCVSTLAVGPILKLLSVRRGMLTMMTLPNGDITFMGKGIAGFKTETVELEHSAEVKAKLAAHINILADKLMTPTEAGPSEVLAGGYVLERAGIIFNGAVYRRLSLASTDVNNIKLTTPSIRLLQRLSDLRQGTVGEVPQRFLAAGHEEVDQVALFDTTGGLQWNFYNTRANQKLGFPPDRVNQVRYVAWDSPKYIYTVLEALDAQTKGERLLVYTNNPLTSQ
ncbi:hypothetical protein CI102_13080, partial [Trichoderma harzianum]